LVKATVALQRKADETAHMLKPILDRINPDKSMSLRKVAQVLNNEGVTTPRGKGQWYASTVKNVYQRLLA